MRKTVKIDLAVLGAGLAGMCSAVSAARNGLRVALVNDRSVLGGNASSEIMVGVHGANHHSLNPAVYAKEGGLIEELRLKLLKYNQNNGYGKGVTPSLVDAVFFDFIYEEENISLFLNTMVTNVKVDNKKIIEIEAIQQKTNVTYSFIADSYIDATGDGVVGYLAGCDYRMGREGKDEFGEKWAAEKSDKFTMGNTLYFETENMGRKVEYTPPKFAHNIFKMEFLQYLDIKENFRSFTITGPHWTYEYGGQVDTIKDSEEITLELRKLIYGIWDYVKNSGKYPQSENYALKRVYAVPGTRESRRIVGDYILTENDIEDNVVFDDGVAMGGWPMDVHAPHGIYDPEPAANFISVVGLYNIPFRCLYSKDINNLMMAGRDISVTHVALGTTRLMATCACIGQAVGTAAYLCKKYSTTPRGIYNNYLDELKDLLVDEDQSIIGAKTAVDMNKDWTITASSYAKFQNLKEENVKLLDKNYGLAIPLVTKEIGSVEVKLKNYSVEDQKVKVSILKGNRKDTYIPTYREKEIEFVVAANYDGWLKFELNSTKGDDEKIYIVFENNLNIGIYTSKSAPIGAVTHRYHISKESAGFNHDTSPLDSETGFQGIDHHYERHDNILFKNIIPAQEIYHPQMLLNGYTRPYGLPNMWISNDNSAQKLEFVATKPAFIQKLQIIFDTDLTNDSLRQMPINLVKEYIIRVFSKDSIKEIVEKDNWRRCVDYSVNATDVYKVEIELIQSHGSSFGVFSVRFS